MKDQDMEKVSLFKLESSKAQEPSFKILFQFANRSDLLLLTIGIAATSIFAVSPVVEVIQSGGILEIMEDNYDNEDKFFDAERDLAFTNYVLGSIIVVVGMIAVVCFIKIRTRQGLFWKQAYFVALVNRPINGSIRGTPQSLGIQSTEIAMQSKWAQATKQC